MTQQSKHEVYFKKNWLYIFARKKLLDVNTKHGKKIIIMIVHYFQKVTVFFTVHVATTEGQSKPPPSKLLVSKQLVGLHKRKKKAFPQKKRAKNRRPHTAERVRGQQNSFLKAHLITFLFSLTGEDLWNHVLLCAYCSHVVPPVHSCTWQNRKQ